MTSLVLGPKLSMPLDAVTQTFAILAKRGAGKTYTALVLVEEFLRAGLRVVVADPVGVTWGLRAAANGKDPGLPIVVLGGDHGDARLEVSAGQVVADLVVEDQLSLVLDLSLFRKAEQVRFMADFAERLYHKNRQPLHLVLDEADAFAPQRPMGGQERMLGAVEDLVRRGRARGIGVTLVTQRAAVLNKDVLTQVEVLIALRTISPQDRGAVDEWIKVHGTPEQRRELMDSLPSLPIGTAWVWSPGWLDVFQRVDVRKRLTFDSSATPTGKPIAPKQLATVDLDRLKTRIAATIERARADDPQELRRRIAALERDLKAAAHRQPATAERVEVSILEPADRELIAGAVREVAHQSQQVRLAMESVVEAAAQRILDTAAPALAVVARLSQVLGRSQAPQVPARRPQPPPARPGRGSNGRPVTTADLGRGGDYRMLVALAQERGPMTDGKLSLLTGIAKRGGTFRTYLGRLRQTGWVEGTWSALSITEAGRQALGSYEPLPTGAALIEYWRGRLGTGGLRAIFDCLVEAYPSAMEQNTLADVTELAADGGTFRTYLGRLRTMGLVTGNRSGLQASATLFE